MYGVRQQSMPGFRGVLLVVVGLDLALRYGDVLFGFVLAGLSLTIGVGLLDVSQWLVVFVGLALIAGKLYPPPMRDFADEASVRLVTAAAATAMAMVLTTIDGLDDAGRFVSVAVGFSVAIALVFRLLGASVFDVESPLVRGLDWVARGEDIARQELADAKTYEGWVGTFALGAFAVAVHVVLVAPVLVAGVLTVMLVETFPLPDLLVIAYLLGGVVAERTERVSAPPEVLQVDDYLLTFARQARNGIHGIFLALLFGVGIFMTITMPVLVLRSATGLLLSAFEPPILPVLTWNVVGFWALYLTGAFYGLWFWLRMIPRIVAFLERWNDEPREAPLDSRPKSLLVPSLVATMVATAGLANGFLGANRSLFAVAWPLTVAGVSWVVFRAYRHHPRTARNEDVAVAAATLLACLLLIGNLAIVSGDLGRLVSPKVGLLCGMVLYVTGVGRVNRYATRHDRRYGDGTDDERRYALSVYLGIGGLLALLTTRYLDGPIRVLVLVGGVALVVFGLALGVTKYYRL